MLEKMTAEVEGAVNPQLGEVRRILTLFLSSKEAKREHPIERVLFIKTTSREIPITYKDKKYHLEVYIPTEIHPDLSLDKEEEFQIILSSLDRKHSSTLLIPSEEFYAEEDVEGRQEIDKNLESLTKDLLPLIEKASQH